MCSLKYMYVKKNKKNFTGFLKAKAYNYISMAKREDVT